jgi:hypothetical protein
MIAACCSNWCNLNSGQESASSIDEQFSWDAKLPILCSPQLKGLTTSSYDVIITQEGTNSVQMV